MTSTRKRARQAPIPQPGSRAAQVQRLRRRLIRSGWPRLQMLLIVALTSGAGLLASWLLLSAGTQSIGLRYALAVAIAYVVFLGLLWIWLRSDSNDYIDFPNLPSSRSDSSQACATAPASDTPATAFDATSNALSASDTKADSLLGEVGDVLGSGDEIGVPLVIVIGLLIALAGLLVVIANVVWSAPVLFAELLFDGVLATALYRRLRREDSRHWLETAVRRTVWPFVIALVLASVTGFALQSWRPEAVTLGQALEAAPSATR